ncbi:MAG: helix-turn-helix domain-containing protein [Candidatus Marinimicrobia bacterium]|nr:helix-turn-helix domain-containing protein [Candidatus Neomarinimicrobiota bacterium]
MTKEIMGVNEVANYLNIKKQTVYRLLQDKKLPALKIGGQWKVKKDHLDKMFDEMLNEKLKEING